MGFRSSGLWISSPTLYQLSHIREKRRKVEKQKKEEGKTEKSEISGEVGVTNSWIVSLHHSICLRLNWPTLVVCILLQLSTAKQQSRTPPHHWYQCTPHLAQSFAVQTSERIWRQKKGSNPYRSSLDKIHLGHNNTKKEQLNTYIIRFIRDGTDPHWLYRMHGFFISSRLRCVSCRLLCYRLLCRFTSLVRRFRKSPHFSYLFER